MDAVIDEEKEKKEIINRYRSLLRYMEGKADSKGSQNFTSLNPSYACESMKTGKRVSKCNSGIFFQVGKKNNEKNITGKFSFSYENLNGGVKHEYGLKLKTDF